MDAEWWAMDTWLLRQQATKKLTSQLSKLKQVLAGRYYFLVHLHFFSLDCDNILRLSDVAFICPCCAFHSSAL
jgi:hypothetical protein